MALLSVDTSPDSNITGDQPASSAAPVIPDQNATPPAVPPPPPPPPVEDDKPTATGDPGSQGASTTPSSQLQGSAAAAPQPPLPTLNPFNPIDWAKRVQDDAYGTWQLGKKAYAVGNALLDGKAVGQSVQNIWGQSTAEANLAKAMLTTVNKALPPASLYQAVTGKSDEQTAADVAGGVLPMTANPLNVLAPEGLAAKLGLYAGAPVAQGLLSGDENERNASLVWAGLMGSVLGGGKLGAVGRAAVEANPALQQIIDTAAQHAQGIAAENKGDWITQALGNPVLEASRKTLAEPATTPVQDAALKAILKKAGVDDIQGLHDAATEGRLTPGVSKFIQQHWQDTGLDYALEGISHGDMPLRDPRVPMADMADQTKATRALTAAHILRDYINQGEFAGSSNPLTGVFRNLMGFNRGLKIANQGFTAAMLDLAGHLDGKVLSKAWEGDQAAYDSLPAEGKVYTDTLRMLGNELRIQRESLGRGNAVANWMPHIEKLPSGTRGPGAGQGGAVLTGMAERHRALALGTDENGKIVMQQAFPTVTDAQAARVADRTRLASTLTDPARPIPKEFGGSPEAQRIRDLAVAGDPTAAKEAARLAKEFRPDFEDNAHLILNRSFGSQIAALHTQQALKHLQGVDVQVATKDGLGTQLEKAAIDPVDQYATKRASDLGYRPVQLPGFGSIMVHPDFAQQLEGASNHLKSYQENPAWFQKLLGFERKAVSMIMYSPAVHTWNLGTRMAAYAGQSLLTHPLDSMHYVFGGDKAVGGTPGRSGLRAMLPTQVDYESENLRHEAARAGVVLSSRFQRLMPDVYEHFANATGDHNVFQIPIDHDLTDANGNTRDLSPLAKVGLPKNPLAKMTSLMWRWSSDFGTAVYHLEKQALIKEGLSEQDASAWAARRANTWMGHLAPEDQNAMGHQMASLAMFAPNWWRTWAEILAPAYRGTGVPMSPGLAKHIAAQTAATTASMLALQKGAGHVLNWIGSGKGQADNQAGSQDKVEVTRPGLVQALQAARYPGADKMTATNAKGEMYDPATGAKLTMENPLGRIQYDAEKIAGLQSGQPNWKPGYAADGLAAFTAARLAPIAGAVGGLLNTDIYKSIASHSAQTLDPNAPVGRPTAGSTVMGLLPMMPGGMELSSALGRAMQSASATKDLNNALPWSTQLPEGIQKAMGVGMTAAKDGPGIAEKAGASFLTGINPPAPHAQKSEGQTPSSEDYLKAQQMKDQYTQQAMTLSAEALGGAKRPSEWLKAQQDLDKWYRGTQSANFLNAPHYVNGTEGLTARWEDLYVKNTQPDGTINYAGLDKDQAAFKAEVGPDGMAAVQNELAKNKNTIPMKALYLKTIDAYGNWQKQWAVANGVSINDLRAQLAGYNAVYADQAASQKYLQANPKLAAYEKAKATQFETSDAGLMYGLFFDSKVVSRYLAQRHMTPAQVIQRNGGSAGNVAPGAPTTQGAPVAPTLGIPSVVGGPPR